MKQVSLSPDFSISQVVREVTIMSKLHTIKRLQFIKENPRK